MDRAVTVRVRDVVTAISTAFPPDRAEPWDRVGLLAGDASAEVTGVALSLDPTLQAVANAAAVGANVLVTHHPAFLSAPERVLAGRGPAGVVHAAVASGVALVNAHTNLDRDARAQELMGFSLGLVPVAPLERSTMDVSVVTAFVPDASVEAVVAAMTDAGAGRIGAYEGCAFTTSGTGGFTAPWGSDPAVGAAGEATAAAEVRVEMVCPRSSAARVVLAAAAAHPYEEPLVEAVDATIARNAWRLGRICEPDGEITLEDLVGRAVALYGVTPRVWGDPDTVLRSIATATGSAGSLVPDAVAAGADALVAGEVRYHDALEARASGLCVVEVGHDASEWPLVGLLHEVVLGVEGLEAADVHALEPAIGWWTPRENGSA